MVIALAPLLIAACATAPDYAEPLPTRQEVVERTIQERIERGESSRAIQRLKGLDENTLPGDRFAALWSEAVAGIEREFEQHVSDGDWEQAVAAYRSLRTLAEHSSQSDDARAFEEREASDWDLNELYIAWADSYREEDNEVAALNLFLKAPRFGESPEEDLIEYGRLAVEQNHRFAVESVISALDDRDLEIPESLTDYVTSRTEISDMLVGTATVEVDRGIRIRDGVGQRDQVMGSGFFIDKRGYLVTNYHVIRSEVDPKHDGYSRLYIRLSENPSQRIPARVVGYDRILDVALVKAEVDPQYVFSLTDVRELRPGATVYAMGSPGGLSSSISSGIISATGRRYLQLGEAMQIDAGLNPGNSGGPVVNESGQLVGVAFAGIPQFENVNFAVPSLWIQHIVPRLYQGNEVRHSWMGASVHERRGSLEVKYVLPNSPAHEAGLKVGDSITAIDGTEVGTLAEAQELMLERQRGSLIRVDWTRDGSERNGLLALAERPHNPVLEAVDKDVETAVLAPLFGMTVRELSRGIFRTNYTIERVFSGGIADETGLSPQDPFALQDLIIDEDRGVAILRISIRQRKAGFMTRGIQLASLLEIDNFI